MHLFPAALTTATASSVSYVRNICSLFSPSRTPPLVTSQDEVNMITFLTSFVTNYTGLQSYRELLSTSCAVLPSNVSIRQDRSTSVKCVKSSPTSKAAEICVLLSTAMVVLRKETLTYDGVVSQFVAKTFVADDRQSSASVVQFSWRLKTEHFYRANRTRLNIALA